MPRLSDLVVDSRLNTQFRSSITIHSFLEIDDTGRRSSQEEHWKLEQSLGRGGFGQVRLERCTTGTKQGALRAVKIIDTQSKSYESLDFNRELEAVAKFSHNRYKRWFVKSFGWYEDRNSIFIAMEYCRYGDLHHYLQHQGCVPAAEVQHLTHQMLEGLNHMHQNDFAHRDLKPGNILIKTMPPKEDWWIVLADFGISKRADEGHAPTTVIKGTDGFMAPELLGFLEQAPKNISDFKAADIWALGEIIVQMLVSKATFENLRELMTYCLGQQKFPSNRLPSSIGVDGNEFVCGLMEVHPSKRMTASQSLEHRWMEFQYVGLEEGLGGLNLESNSLPGFIRPDTAPNHSASWTNLSGQESESVQTIGRWRSVSSTNLYQRGPRQENVERLYSNPLTRHDREAGQETVFLPTAALKTLEGHSNGVRAVAFSPDGKTLASASVDKTVRLWDGRTGAALKTIKGHSYPVLAVAFSPDGKTLASASVDKTVRLWDRRSGAALKTLEGHSNSALAVAFSPDGKTLASASADKTVRLWDGRSGVALSTLEGHSGYVNAVAFSPDGKTLASASVDKTVRLWDGRSGAALKTLEGHSNSVYAVAFSPDGKTLASASADKTVRLWDGRSGAALKTLKGHSDFVYAMAFSPDGKTLTSASYDKTVRLWDGRSGAALKTLKGHSNSVYAVAFSPDGKTLASASADKTVRLWG